MEEWPKSVGNICAVTLYECRYNFKNGIKDPRNTIPGAKNTHLNCKTINVRSLKPLRLQRGEMSKVGGFRKAVRSRILKQNVVFHRLPVVAAYHAQAMQGDFRYPTPVGSKRP